MKTIQVNNVSEIPVNYTGIVHVESGTKIWYKNGKWHREDGPAYISISGWEEWHLNGKFVWHSEYNKLDFTNKIVLLKEQYPEYPTIQIWKWIDKNGIREQMIISGMEECVKK